LEQQFKAQRTAPMKTLESAMKNKLNRNILVFPFPWPLQGLLSKSNTAINKISPVPSYQTVVTSLAGS
jgi:hypothetical protein